MAKSSSEDTFSLLTWNIYGLQHSYLQERTTYVCEYIAKHNPSVVFLQELVHQTWPYITQQLGDTYSCYCGTPKAHYFPGLLIKKTRAKEESVSVIDFPTSTQGRYMLRYNMVERMGCNITLLTSHIESMDRKPNIEERKRQLKVAFDIMASVNAQGDVAIFGGDMNTFDNEISDIGLPGTVEDVWVFTGSDKKQCKTWNTNVLIHRPDRVYFGPTAGPLVPTRFEVIGREKVPGKEYYPSDHLGIWVDFQLKEENK